MKITRKDVRYVADLANLELTEAEKLRMEKDLNSILEYVDQLSELNTDDLEPMTQVSQATPGSDSPRNCLRADELRPCLPHNDAMSNAPQSDGTFFRVPKVIEK